MWQQHCWRDHVPQMLPRFATRAMYVADTNLQKHFLWPHKSYVTMLLPQGVLVLPGPKSSVRIFIFIRKSYESHPRLFFKNRLNSTDRELTLNVWPRIDRFWWEFFQRIYHQSLMYRSIRNIENRNLPPPPTPPTRPQHQRGGEFDSLPRFYVSCRIAHQSSACLHSNAKAATRPFCNHCWGNISDINVPVCDFWKNAEQADISNFRRESGPEVGH